MRVRGGRGLTSWEGCAGFIGGGSCEPGVYFRGEGEGGGGGVADSLGLRGWEREGGGRDRSAVFTWVLGLLADRGLCREAAGDRHERPDADRCSIVQGETGRVAVCSPFGVVALSARRGMRHQLRIPLSGKAHLGPSGRIRQHSARGRPQQTARPQLDASPWLRKPSQRRGGLELVDANAQVYGALLNHWKLVS